MKEQLPKNYKHLFFDLDHTLWDFEQNAKETLMDVYEHYQLQEKMEITFDHFHTSYRHHNATLWARFEKGFISIEELKWKRMWRTLLDFKIGDEPLARNMSQQFIDWLPTKTALFPHTIESLEYLIENKYKLHLITNGFSKTQELKLKNSGIDKFFLECITSEKSNSMKPKKEIFDFALQITGAKLEESIMFGDNLHADIKGANDAGMDSVFVNHINDPSPHEATFSITHLSEIRDLF